MSSTGDDERARDEAGRSDDADRAARAARADEAAWQSIIDNYGERAELDEPRTPAERPEAAPAPEPRPRPVDHEERFVPPPPPPLPRPEPRRAIAWAGLFVAPLLVLVASVLKLDLAPLLDYALVAWFVGGFVYLVATMSKTPRDPWDDGSRV